MAYHPNQKDLYHYFVEIGFEDDYDFQGEDGKPVFLDYREVDWKGLSRDLRGVIGSLPQSVGFYVANEPSDMSDAHAFAHVLTPEQGGEHLMSAFNELEAKDYRAGVINLAPQRDKLHPSHFPQEAAPPAIGIFIAVKCTGSQFMDYEYALCKAFGFKPITQLMLAGRESVVEDVFKDIPTATHDIFLKHLKLPYRAQCSMKFLFRSPA